jgi:hypothetical protein
LSGLSQESQEFTKHHSHTDHAGAKRNTPTAILLIRFEKPINRLINRVSGILKQNERDPFSAVIQSATPGPNLHTHHAEMNDESDTNYRSEMSDAQQKKN